MRVSYLYGGHEVDKRRGRNLELDEQFPFLEDLVGGCYQRIPASDVAEVKGIHSPQVDVPLHELRGRGGGEW